ncbi:MAG: hypothetical protein HFG29_03890 [Eubacterium sp.]|nr:hypothetical protein [Eubacterium sp.]
MKQIFKKTITLLLVLALSNSIMGNSYYLIEVYAETYEDEGKKCHNGTSLKEIENIAHSFINTSKKFSKSKWENCTIDSERVLFDSDDNISAYYIGLIKNGKKCGYVILEAHAPWSIIEYSYEGQSFLEIAEEEVEKDYNIDENKQKVYYLGGLSYVVSGKNNNGKKIYVDVSINNMEKMSKKRLQDIEKDNSSINNKGVSFKSRPDGSGDGYITSPEVMKRVTIHINLKM